MERTRIIAMEGVKIDGEWNWKAYKVESPGKMETSESTKEVSTLKAPMGATSTVWEKTANFTGRALAGALGAGTSFAMGKALPYVMSKSSDGSGVADQEIFIAVVGEKQVELSDTARNEKPSLFDRIGEFQLDTEQTAKLVGVSLLTGIVSAVVANSAKQAFVVGGVAASASQVQVDGIDQAMRTAAGQVKGLFNSAVFIVTDFGGKAITAIDDNVVRPACNVFPKSMAQFMRCPTE